MNPGILDALRVLTGPGQIIELRALGDRVASGYYDNPGDLDRAAEILDTPDAQGIYITLNPVKPALFSRRANRVKSRLSRSDATTADGDIVSRRWLPIDIDPLRPSGISSSEAEHQAALRRADEIAAFLSELGFPDPVVADSGNGGHLLYRIDLPNDKASHDLVRSCLASLDTRFSDEICRIDTTNANAARIWKLYGTIARKGDSTADRPHRRACLVRVPDDPGIVTVNILHRLASLYPAVPVSPPAGGYEKNGFTLGSWLDRHLPGYREKPYLGGTLYLLDACPFSAAHTDGAYAIQFANGAVFAGCHHDSCGGGTQRWQELKERFSPGLSQKKTGPPPGQAGPLPASSLSPNPIPSSAQPPYPPRSLTQAQVGTQGGGLADSQVSDPSCQQEAIRIMEQESPLRYMLDTFATDHEGDRTVAESLFMSLASRSVINSKGLHVSITGESGKGKSHAIDTVMKQVPPAFRLDGRISEKALFYIAGMQPGTVIALDDHALSDQMQEILKGVTSSFQRPFVYRTVSKDRTGQVCTIPERCVWWIAKVEGAGDDQIFNRMLTCWIDDSEDQDLRVLERTLDHAGKGPVSAGIDRVETRVCQEIWQQMEAVFVIIPYAHRIRFISAANRRNPDMLLDLIRSSAALMQRQRKREEIGGISCIHATEEDFIEASRLYAALNGESGSQATKLTRREAELAAVMHHAGQTGGYEMTVSDLQHMTGWNNSSLYKLLNGYMSRGQTYSGLLAKCPAVSFLDRAVSSGDDGRPTQRRVRVYTWDPSLYASWIGGGEVWLAPADDSGHEDPNDPDTPVDPPVGGSAGKEGSFLQLAGDCRPKNPVEITQNNKNNLYCTDQDLQAAEPGEVKQDPGTVADDTSQGLVSPICRTAAHTDQPGSPPPLLVNPGQESCADAPALSLPAAARRPVSGIRPSDFIAVEGWPQKKPCMICGRPYTRYQERMTFERLKEPHRPNRMLCSVCYEAAQVRESLAVRTIPGVIDTGLLQHRNTPSGRCGICHTGAAVWVDPSQQVAICETCYQREKRLQDRDGS